MLRLLNIVTLALACAHIQAAAVKGNSTNPVVDLGNAGTYIGVLQNNGTVQAWKGIPYATPPVGDLRFKAPTPLAKRKGKVVDVTDDALRCVQFGAATNIVGVKAGPGQEDCLKLWVWKPVTAKAGDKLPVSVYIHGGGLQFSSAPNNDMSDWVGQEQNFVAINLAYRLGAFGFLAHEELAKEGQHANAALLDMRLAIEWVRDNVKAFGGDPNKITIMGQSGGGLAVVGQMALYDGKASHKGNGKLPYQQAVARSIQRAPVLTIANLKERNDMLATTLNCTTSSQLKCFRNATPAEFVAAANAVTALKDSNNLTFGGFMPAVDGYTLTDTITKLFQKGKIASVPFIAGAVSHEAANAVLKNITEFTAANIGAYNLSASHTQDVLNMYGPGAVNGTWGQAYSTGPYFTDVFRATLAGVSGFGEGGITGSERWAAKSMCKKGKKECAKTWSFRYGAPTVGTAYPDAPAPLNFVAHSADNSYLQNATAVMTSFEKKLAYEWRAYIGSFIRTGDPNTEKLSAAPHWPTYNALGSLDTPLRLVPSFAYAVQPGSYNFGSTNTTAGGAGEQDKYNRRIIEADQDVGATGTFVEVMSRAQRDRTDWWLTDAVLKETKL